jgi:hypothetical protein
MSIQFLFFCILRRYSSKYFFSLSLGGQGCTPPAPTNHPFSHSAAHTATVKQHSPRAPYGAFLMQRGAGLIVAAILICSKVGSPFRLSIHICSFICLFIPPVHVLS